MTDSDLRAHLFEEGLLEPNPEQVAAVCAGMVQQVVRTAMSMTVADAENLLQQSTRLVKDARKEGDADAVVLWKRGERTARAFLRFRKDLEGLRE